MPGTRTLSPHIGTLCRSAFTLGHMSLDKSLDMSRSLSVGDVSCMRTHHETNAWQNVQAPGMTREVTAQHHHRPLRYSCQTTDPNLYSVVIKARPHQQHVEATCRMPEVYDT